MLRSSTRAYASTRRGSASTCSTAASSATCCAGFWRARSRRFGFETARPPRPGGQTPLRLVEGCEPSAGFEVFREHRDKARTGGRDASTHEQPQSGLTLESELLAR